MLQVATFIELSAVIRVVACFADSSQGGASAQDGDSQQSSLNAVNHFTLLVLCLHTFGQLLRKCLKKMLLTLWCYRSRGDMKRTNNIHDAAMQVKVLNKCLNIIDHGISIR